MKTKIFTILLSLTALFIYVLPASSESANVTMDHGRFVTGKATLARAQKRLDKNEFISEISFDINSKVLSESLNDRYLKLSSQELEEILSNDGKEFLKKNNGNLALMFESIKKASFTYLTDCDKGEIDLVMFNMGESEYLTYIEEPQQSDIFKKNSSKLKKYPGAEKAYKMMCKKHKTINAVRNKKQKQ